MDGYTYVNIFDTKGIEYIIIIVFLLSIIPFYLVLNKKEEIYAEFSKMKMRLSEKIRAIPNGIFYSRNHAWAFLQKTGIARIGADDLVLHMAGANKIVYLKEEDDPVKKGEPIAEIGHNGNSLRIYSPVTGQIKRINPVLSKNPEIILDDTYSKGWLCEIQPSDWKSDTGQYMIAEEAKNWLLKESARVKDFFAVRFENYEPDLLGITLQDGGDLSENILAEMPGEFWEDFQKEFLDPV